MADYVIQKTTKDPYIIERDGGWMPAWGINPKSYPKAESDEAAIRHFHEVTAKCRTPYRLIVWIGYGYSCKPKVLANNDAVLATK